MSRCCLTGARLVLPDEVIDDACVYIEDGIIAAVTSDCPAGVAAIDLRGATLIPGLIDLHCDALEKEAEPRPNVFFPPELAVSQIDRRNAQSGVTTAFHAISFAGKELGVRNIDTARRLIGALRQVEATALIQHRIHCRYEVTDADSVPVLEELLEKGAVDLLSLMDHTPGQGQFQTLDAYRSYLGRSYGHSMDAVDRIVEDKLAQQAGAPERIARLARLATECGIPLASHDDDSAERVATMAALGVRISEFPVTLDAAAAARRHGLATLFGAPNVLRGKSQSGGIRAHDALAQGVAACLCSDYHPGALLPAVLRLHEEGTALPQAIGLVTEQPALAVGLADRGVIRAGLRADLAAFRSAGGVPSITHVWQGGLCSYQARWNHAA